VESGKGLTTWEHDISRACEFAWRLLKWDIVVGPGTITSDGSGHGTYTAPANDQDSSVVLVIEVMTGPETNHGQTYTKGITAPTGIVTERYGIGVYHRQAYASIGIQVVSYLRPADVSFANVKIKEGVCRATSAGGAGGTLTGYFVTRYPNGVEHRPGRAARASNGNAAKGCEILATDIVQSIQAPPHPPYAAGTYQWNIPLYYGATSDPTTEFTNIPQIVTMQDSSGNMTIEKNGVVSPQLGPADPDSDY